MTDATRARLFEWRDALDHPVTIAIGISVAVLMVCAAIVTVALSRAGKLPPPLRKDLRDRLRSWLVLIPLMTVPVLAGAAWTILGVGLLSALCYREFARATGLFREKLVSLLVTLGIGAVTFAELDHWYDLFVALGPLILCFIVSVPIVQDRPKGYLQRVGLGVLSFMLFGIGLGHLGYFANDPLYRPLILTLIVCVEMNDVFAYCVGKTLGGPKLAPSTSPNKTWSGSLGALALTTLLTALFMHRIFAGEELGRWTCCTAMGLILAACGQLGDLVVSSIKRDVGIKDMGTTFPGHGGLLDRFNSMLLVAPALFHFIGYYRGVGLDQPTRIFTGR